jgi:hypothetical protein
MIEGLKPYAEYKESGLPWASRIPAHWTLIPNRAVLRKRKVLVGGKHAAYQLLSLTKGGVIVRDVSTGKGKFSADMGTSQEVRKGDFVFCLFDVPETPRTVGLSIHDGMITSAYTVFETTKLSADGVCYFERFYLAMDDQKLLSPLYSGLRHTIPPPRFLGTKTPFPPPDEQSAIVRFLDHANRKIDGFIRAKRKLIGLLNEQKQAIIHRAVTGKDEVRRMKDEKLFRFRSRSRCFIPKFLVLTLRGQLSRAQIESSTNGASSSMQNIGQGVVKGLWVSLPPVDEQALIVTALAEATHPLTTAIARTEREIALMQEYRTRLTADVVTGKLDVREAAAKLPDPPTDPAAESVADAEHEPIEPGEDEA